MAQYTIEDIEIIRQRSGISYEEAVNLLEYHNGSLARALVDLEKNGRLKDAKAAGTTAKHRGGNILTFLYRTRFKVMKDQVTIINVSLLFLIFTLMTAFWVPVIGIVIALLLLGYRVSIERNSKDFAADSFETIVKNAPSNVKNTVFTMARDLEKSMDAQVEKPADEVQKEEPRTENPASGTTPVNVQFPGEGRVEVKEDGDGFHEADIH